MPFKSFLYYFTEEDGRSLYVQNGIVSSGGTKRPLSNSPEGWQEISIAWERNLAKYYGLNRTFSLPLFFYNDAAFILRNEFYTKNIERKIFLLIQQFGLEYTLTYYKFLYSYLYKGELDFSTFKNDRDRVSISIMEGGLSKLFKANETTNYTIPFDSQAIDVMLDGIFLDGVYRWLLPDAPGLGTAYVGMYQLPADGLVPGLAVFDINEEFISSVPDVNNLNYFAEIRQDINDVHITGTIKDLNQLGAPGPISILLYVWNSVTQSLRLTIDLSPDDPYPEHYDLVVDQTLDLIEGDRLFLRRGTVFSESTLQLAAKSKYKTTACRAYLPLVAFKKLTEKITGSQDNAESTLLSNSTLALTCGDAIRSIPTASIKTNISDFFTDYDVTCFAGLSIDNGKIKIEGRASFFDPSNPIDLGYVKNHEQSFASDLVGSSLKVGHTKPDIEDLNGKFDPNGSSVFTFPITRVAKEISLVGPYKKGPYEIELKRIILDGQVTTDNNIDQECFVLDVKAVPETFSNVSGDYDGIKELVLPGMWASNDIFNMAKGFYLNSGTVEMLIIVDFVFSDGTDLHLTIRNTHPTVSLPNSFSNYTIRFPHILNRSPIVDPDPEVGPSPETMFNVRLTPMNILLTHKQWWASLLMGFGTDKMKFQSGDKNTKFKATVNGVIIDEDTDVNVSSLGTRLFFPVYHDIETLVPINLVDLMEENPNRCFKFTDIDTDEVFTGFNIKSGLAPNELQPQQLKLLSSPLNDLTKLIY